MFAEELHFCHAKAVLCSNSRARFVDAWRYILACLCVHAVVLHDKGILATSNKLDETCVYAFKCLLNKWFLSSEDAISLVVEVEDFAHRLPRLHVVVREQAMLILCRAFGMCGFRESDRQTMQGKLPKETLTTGVCTIVRSIEYAPVEVIAIFADVVHPTNIRLSFVLADRVSVFVHVAP